METNTNARPRGINLNKPAYVIFALAGIYLMVTKDFSQATIFWGLALVFDPFNIETPFSKRPFYQRAWLIIHLLVTIVLFALMLLEK